MATDSTIRIGQLPMFETVPVDAPSRRTVRFKCPECGIETVGYLTAGEKTRRRCRAIYQKSVPGTRQGVLQAGQVCGRFMDVIEGI